MKEIKLSIICNIDFIEEFGELALEKLWLSNNLIHREDGAAWNIPWDGMKYYYMYGYQVDKEKYCHTLDEQVLGW